jgi:hypothetical protein
MTRYVRTFPDDDDALPIGIARFQPSVPPHR